MPLFVPILRLLMLFLNIYDSYKTLKIPPPSSRNGGRPSIRAMSQRKRDMKGCLAVWVVWVTLSMYERMLESIVCLLIPFYDELKSLVLLFLILTRARGAEPIYLHVIRPLVKPYTSTLDSTLELLLMIGDFIFALSMYPIHLGMEWWQRRFSGKSDGFATAQEGSSSEYSSDADISDPPSSLSAYSATPGSANTASIFLSKPSPNQQSTPSRQSTGETTTRKSTAEASGTGPQSVRQRAAVDSQSRRPSGDSQHTEAGRKRKGTSNFLESSRHRSTSPSRQSGKCDNVVSDVEANKINPSQDATRQHQIWYPPKHASSDGEDFLQSAVLEREQQQLDEWRQYPAFPSAYPPTPLAVTSKLAAASVAVYAAIDEEPPQQDFRPSLLPPREPLNPSPAGGLSDVNITTMGISHSDHSNDSMSSEDYEEEDAFNITLRTPLPAFESLRSLRPQVHRHRHTGILSTSPSVSVASRASALTTSDVGSPLQTHGSASESSKLSESIPIIGKKRSFPRHESHTVANRVRKIEQIEASETSEDDLPPASTLKSMTLPSSNDNIRAPEGNSSTSKIPDETAGIMPSSGEDSLKENVRRLVPPEAKRRKVLRTSTRITIPVHPLVPSRARVAKRASPPKQPQKGKFLDVPAASKRSSSRIGTTSAAPQLKHKADDDAPNSSSSSLPSNDQVSRLASQKSGIDRKMSRGR